MSDSNGKPRSLEELLQQQTVLARFGDFALRSDSLDDILTEACRLVAQAMKTEFAKVLERREGHSLLVRAGVGWKEGVVGHAELPDGEGSSGGYALRTGKPVITSNAGVEDRFAITDLLREHGVKAMVNVIIPGTDGRPPFGVLEVDSRVPRHFSADDVAFLRSYANLLGAAVDRIHSVQAVRTALEAKHRLLLELQHRIKNNLQVITSLIHLQAHHSQNPETRRELRAIGDRIEALRLVHEKLYAAGEIDRVDLGPYIGELSASLIKFHNPGGSIRLRTDIQSLDVTPELAVPLGLIANEFITNSLKYAFDGNGGVMGVEIHARNAERACMTLWDSGKGLPPDPQETKGTGLTIIRGLIRQIGAEAKWEAEGGTRLEIRFTP